MIAAWILLFVVLSLPFLLPDQFDQRDDQGDMSCTA